jgi:FkbM family methyltransferase
VAFDLGANVGVISMLLSRLVGPKGMVCAFEASPRIVGFCQRNLSQNGCGNTQLFRKAVYRNSGEWIPIYDMGELNDTILPRAASRSVGSTLVETLALDDFVSATGFVPDVLKSDIEGAEYEMLLGARRLLEEHRPTMILEQNCRDDRCLNLLSGQGYTALDLNTYQRIRTKSDYPPEHTLRNLLFVHESRIGDTPFHRPLETSLVVSFGPAQMVRSFGRRSRCFGISELNPGRYMAHFDFTDDQNKTALALNVKVGAVTACRYGGRAHQLRAVCAESPFQVDSTTEVELSVEDRSGAEKEFAMIRGLRIHRIDSFDLEKLSPSYRYLA